MKIIARCVTENIIVCLCGFKLSIIRYRNYKKKKQLYILSMESQPHRESMWSCDYEL